MFKTIDKQQQKTGEGLKIVEKPDIMFDILGAKLNSLNPIRDGENCDIMFYTNPRNYYNNN